MTSDDVKQILNQIALRYNSFTRGKDTAQILATWTEDLKHYNLAQAKEALAEYIKQDAKGFPPTSGQLIALMPTDFQPLDASEFFKGTVKCPYCNDSGFTGRTVEYEGAEIEVYKPCENCRKTQYDIWEKYLKGRDPGAVYVTTQDNTTKVVRN